MAEIFAEQWMQKMKEEWNKEPALANELLNLDFNSTIAYGFKDEDEPRGILVIEKGNLIRKAQSMNHVSYLKELTTINKRLSAIRKILKEGS